MQVEKTLGKEGLKNMHIHLSGIHYTEKGERHHLPLQESDMNYKDLLKTLREFKSAGVLISESPIIEKDALLMKNIMKRFNHLLSRYFFNWITAFHRILIIFFSSKSISAKVLSCPSG